MKRIFSHRSKARPLFWSCYVILVHILSRRTVRKHLKHLRSGTHPLHFTHVTASARALSWWGSPWEGCTHSPPKKSDQPMHKPLPGKWSAPLIHHGSRLACRICCKDKWVNHWESLIHPNPTKGWLLEPWKNCYGKKVESGTCQKAVSSFQKKSPNMLLGCVDTADHMLGTTLCAKISKEAAMPAQSCKGSKKSTFTDTRPILSLRRLRAWMNS